MMRAKMRVWALQPDKDSTGAVTQERVKFYGVSRSTSYPADGSDEDNTFAKFSPSVALEMTIANPALFGKLAVGDTFYVDFTPVP